MGALIMRVLLFEVSRRAADFWKLATATTPCACRRDAGKSVAVFFLTSLLWLCCITLKLTSQNLPAVTRGIQHLLPRSNGIQIPDQTAASCNHHVQEMTEDEIKKEQKKQAWSSRMLFPPWSVEI